MAARGDGVDLQEVREHLDAIPTGRTIQAGGEEGYRGLLEVMRNDLLATGGGRLNIHEADGRVVHCEDVGSDGTLSPVPEERWYEFLDEA